MIIITAQKYYNDYKKQLCRMTFDSLTDLLRFMKQISLDFTNKSRTYFPRPEDGSFKWCGRIAVDMCADSYYTDFWIHKIENANGIIYSDGYFTDGVKFCSKSVREWLVNCAEYIRKKYTFVDE